MMGKDKQCKNCGAPMSPMVDHCKQCGHPTVAGAIGDLGKGLFKIGCGLLALLFLLAFLGVCRVANNQNVGTAYTPPPAPNVQPQAPSPIETPDKPSQATESTIIQSQARATIEVELLRANQNQLGILEVHYRVTNQTNQLLNTLIIGLAYFDANGQYITKGQIMASSFAPGATEILVDNLWNIPAWPHRWEGNIDTAYTESFQSLKPYIQLKTLNTGGN